MWRERADRVRREIAALAAAGLGVGDLEATGIRRIGAVVGADLTCWVAIDTEELVVSTVVSGEDRIPAEYGPRLAEADVQDHLKSVFAETGVRSRGDLVAHLRPATSTPSPSP
ncbi:hypothetical protein [Geodermatophilus sp. SYSU D00684]